MWGSSGGRIAALIAGTLALAAPAATASPGDARASDFTCSPFASASANARGQESPFPAGVEDGIGDLDVPTPPPTAAPVAKSISVHYHVITKSDDPTSRIDPVRLIGQTQHLTKAFGGSTIFDYAGVDYTANDAWYAMTPGSPEERAAKTSLRKGGAEDLNFYIPGPGAYAGWGTFPWSYAGSSANDGIVVRNPFLFGTREGDIAVHEVGHWMGLYHTFQNGCRNVGDYVADTPAEADPAVGCPDGRDSCPRDAGRDPIHNYMAYTSEWCQTGFTAGQQARMDSMWVQYRQGR